MAWQCHSIHKTIVDDFKHAVVYGKSVKHQPQRVGLSHELADEDISKSDCRDSCVSVVLAINIAASYHHQAINDVSGRESRSQSVCLPPRDLNGATRRLQGKA